MNFLLPGIMGGLGLIKHFAFDKPKADRERKLEAETQRYSPWTGLSARRASDPNPLDNVMQFGSTGLGLQQQMEMDDALAGYYNRGGMGSQANKYGPLRAPDTSWDYTSPGPWGMIKR